MDTTDGFDYSGMDFVLHEPGMVEDTRIEEQAALLVVEDVDAPLHEALRSFDRSRSAEHPAVACLIRIGGGTIDRDAVYNKLAGNVRPADRCLRDGQGDYVLALADCDLDMARKRINLMMRLAHIDVNPAEGQAWFCAGITPVQSGESIQGMRTARVACELASFQSPGHIEAIEL
jgi:hypothetical protein